MSSFSLKGESSDESIMYGNSDSSDDEKTWAKEVRKNYRLLRKNEREKEQEQEQENSEEEDNNLVAKDVSKLDKIKNDVKFEEGKPTTRRNK